MQKSKSYQISKQVVWEAYCKVKANRGAAGLDKETMERFEGKLKDNLYKIWNRMSSGSYVPPAVLRCEIPKKDGKTRVLGIPTVADRIAQMVVKMYLEPGVEPKFHEDSYGYRPNKSARQALGKTRERCWKYNWVIDMDIKGFFDEINHDQLMQEVQKYTGEKWILLYVERWLKAPMQNKEEEIQERRKGTPQGGVISPLLANIFLHRAFDEWMLQEFPTVRFERYADDIIIHCRTKWQAKHVLDCARERLAEYHLALHPEKTRIVYCKDGNRPGDHKNTSFDFLGYTFRRRVCRKKTGQFFVGFVPAVSQKARKAISQKIRDWKLKSKVYISIEEVAKTINPQIRGWMNYFGAYYRSAMSPILRQVELTLARWLCRKCKKFYGKKVKATKWLRLLWRRKPNLFAHWSWSIG